MPGQYRQKVAVVGAGGSIGTSLSHDLAKDYDVIALVGSREGLPGKNSDPFLSWRSCEPFSRRAVETAIAGCEYIIYLVHTRIPTARLEQAENDDMDLLIADNVARAARRQGVKQIIYLGGLLPEDSVSPRLLMRHNEVMDALSFYGTPLTVLRAGLVVAPGSSTVRLLASIATRFPIVLMPQWANRRKQPIALTDVIRAIRFCLANDETQNNSYDIGGPQVLTFREMLQRAADVLKKKQNIITIPFLPARLYGWYLRLLDRQAHPALIRLAVEHLGHDSVVRSNPVQEFIEKDAVLPREVIEPYIRQWAQLPSNPRQTFLKRYIAGLRSKSNVRSIQRMVLPPGRNAAWVVDTYFHWLPRFTGFLVTCEIDANGNCHYYNRFPRLLLLTMSLQQEQSSSDRRLYFITGGLLAKGHDELTPRFEFRDVLNGRYTIVALHDFRPDLPWYLYLFSQAVMHLIVMRIFQKYIAAFARKTAHKSTSLK